MVGCCMLTSPSAWTDVAPNPANTIRKFLVTEVSLAWVKRVLVAQGRGDGRDGSGLIALSLPVALADVTSHCSLVVCSLLVMTLLICKVGLLGCFVKLVPLKS